MDEQPLRASPARRAAESASTTLREHLDTLTRAADGSGTPGDPTVVGVTFNLGWHDLDALPLEVIDIIKDHVQRLALYHNKLVDLPPRLTECSQLTYLQLRHNEFRRFPEVLLQIPTIEVLDIAKNKLETLPDDLTRLPKLRVFSFHNNRITKLPTCLGHMNPLYRLLLEGNPLKFPPPELWEPLLSEAPISESGKGDEDALTRQVKEFLRNQTGAVNGKTDTESDFSEANLETPRPTRRKTSGRFPIKPSVSGIDISPLPGSPGFQKPPPLPTKSIPRGVVESQGPLMLRTNISPVITNERFRSSSESQMGTTLRNKRMGVLPPARRTPDSAKEPRRPNRFSHLRGLSHASALQGHLIPNSGYDSTNPSSPSDTDHGSAYSGRRLSSLAENMRDLYASDPAIEVVKGMVFAIHQLKTSTEKLARMARRSEPRLSSWESRSSSLFRFVEELDGELMNHGSRTEESETEDHQNPSLSLRNRCETCVNMFEKVVIELRGDIPSLVAHGDLRHVRSLLLQLYLGITELRNACAAVGVKIQYVPRMAWNPSLFHQDSSTARQRPSTSRRVRRDVYQDRNQSLSKTSIPLKPLPTIPNGASFSSTRSSNTAYSNGTATRSDHSYRSYESGSLSSISTSITLQGPEDAEEDRQYENIIAKLAMALELAGRSLPACAYLVKTYKESARLRAASNTEMACWQRAAEKCDAALAAANVLRGRLPEWRMADAATRQDPELWQMSLQFCESFTNFALEAKNVSQYSKPTAQEIKPLLNDLRKTVRGLTNASTQSPWRHLFVPGNKNDSPLIHHTGYGLSRNPSYPSSTVSSQSAMSSGYVTPLPATPLAAALGHAAQATMPLTPLDMSTGFPVHMLNERLDKTNGSRR